MASNSKTFCCCCSVDLPVSSKNKIFIRNRKVEYSTFYDLALDVLKNEQVELQLTPETIHSKLDGVICKSCYIKLKKLSDTLKGVEFIRSRIKELFACNQPGIETENERMDEFHEPETEQCIENEGKAGDNSESCSMIKESNVTKKGLTVPEDIDYSFTTPMKRPRSCLPSHDENRQIYSEEREVVSNTSYSTVIDPLIAQMEVIRSMQPEDVHITPTKRPQSSPFTQTCTRVCKNLLRRTSDQFPQVAVIVGYKSRPKVRQLTDSLKKLGKCVGRGRRLAIVKSVIQNPTLRPHVVSVLSSEARKEIKFVTSRKHDSILRMKTKDSIERFSWDRVWSEIESYCPLLVSFLKGCLPPRLQNNNSSIPSLCVCASIVLKMQNSHVNLVQGIISVLLKSGHANKQVFRHLQKIMICLSYDATLNMMDVIAEGFDQDVLGWKEMLLSRVKLLQSQELFLAMGSSSSASSSVPSIQSNSGDSILAPDYSPIQSSDESVVPDNVSSSGQSDQPNCLHSNNLSPTNDKEQDICDPFQETWHGYVLAGDNLDCNVRPRHQTFQSQTRLLHWFNAVAVHDRCDFSSLKDAMPTRDFSSFDVRSLLPDRDDCQQLISNLSVLVGRLLVKYLPEFSKYSSLVEPHIIHPYSSEMSRKSCVVPLGISLKNEMKVSDMVDILDDHHQYVPSSSAMEAVTITNEEESEYIRLDSLHIILYFGDQLTVEHMRGAQAVRSNSENGIQQLRGFIPAVADWHAKVSFLGTIFKRLYSDGSMAEGGTLCQLRYLINRTNVPMKPKDNVNATEEFFETVVISHIIAAALHYFKMDDTSAVPKSDDLSKIEQTRDIPGKQKLFYLTMQNMIERYINITPFNMPEVKEDDQVRAYAKEVLSLGAILMEFNDAVQEGDGERLLRVWKFLLLAFRSSNKKKYTLEGLLLLIQANFLLPPRLKYQLMYSRFVNTRGGPGKNIPMDLHVEHVNRIVKSAIYHQMSNLSPTAIIRTSRCTGSFVNTTEQFDRISSLHCQSSSHSEANLDKIFHRIVIQLHKTSKVFNFVPQRQHLHFKSVSGSIMNSLKSDSNHEKLVNWMEGHLKSAVMNS